MVVRQEPSAGLDWEATYERLSARDQRKDLELNAVEEMACAAYMTGRHRESIDHWTRAHQGFLEQGDVARAVRCAYWISFGLHHRGEHARASGWIARAKRILEEADRPCVEEGYLLLPLGMQHIGQGDISGAHSHFARALEIAVQYDDADLAALSRHSCGRVLIRMGEIDEGVQLLDEAMAAIEAGDVSVMAAGDVYCSVIEGCIEIFDLRRAQEWTTALTQWCDSQHGLRAYRGQCLVRRSEILQLHGEWPVALTEAREACERLSHPPGEPAAGAAFYQLGELHRLHGNFEEAEKCYAHASRWGKKPQPGVALLRLAQGQVDAAAAAIRREEGEARARRARAVLLPAFIEIMIEAGDVESARRASEELAAIAADLDAPYVHAVAAHARGAVYLADSEPERALHPLRDAWKAWTEIGAPYEAARVRLLIARACRELKDLDSATMEAESACAALRALGAAPALTRASGLVDSEGSQESYGLTPRELEVLRLVATGLTNEAIGEKLFISKRTVERHVSNILSKLDLPSRAAATAYAYEHQVV